MAQSVCDYTWRFVPFTRAHKQGRVLKTRIVPHFFSIHFSFIGSLRKPLVTKHPSILNHPKQCCLFAVSLPWFPLCQLPALVWRTKCCWWVVFGEEECINITGNYIYVLFLHTLRSLIRISNVIVEVERQLYYNSSLGVSCFALSSLIF